MRPEVARPPLLAILLLALAAMAAAALVRLSLDARVHPIEGADQTGWLSAEPDGLYHMRRALRALEEDTIATRDPRMNFPEGAPIPWPSIADRANLALVSWFAPSDPEARHRYLERTLSWLPFVWSLLTTGMLVWGAALLSRSLLAASLAGFAFLGQYAAAHYAAPGVADHHAWVSLLGCALVLVCSGAWRPQVLADPQRSAHQGVAAGVLAGLMLGSWVASLVWLLAVQLALYLSWWRDSSGARPGLRSFGLSFHLSAALLLLPEVLASPWKAEHPWMVVNLSWFHLAELLAGALVFLPRRRSRLAISVVPAGILLLLLSLLAADFGPGAGIREGFAWVSRADAFMAGIAESAPLLPDYLHWAGYAIFLTPLLWLGLLRGWWRGRSEWGLLVVLLPLATAQAFTQIRFAEALAVPLALSAGLLAAAWLGPWLHGPRARLVQPLLGAVLGIALMPGAWAASWSHQPPGPASLAEQALPRWIGQRSPRGPAAEAQESVLAPWDFGHAIEWRTGFGSVATNFGSYLGIEGFQAPARFFLSRDRAQARAILARHRVRYVIRPSRLTLGLESLQTGLGAELPAGGFVRVSHDAQGRRRTQLTPAWFDTMAAQLGLPLLPAPDGRRPGLGDPDGPQAPARPVDFLRLVHVSPIPDEDPRHGGIVQPSGMIWEHVPGARVSHAAAPGERLRVDLGVILQAQGQEVLRFQHVDQTPADPATGRAALRVPYNTSLANGDAQVAYANWELVTAAGEVRASGALAISEEAVQQGGEVPLD